MKEITGQKYISRRPGFAERWALILFLMILAALFAAAWFVKYPELIKLNGTLESGNGGYYVKTLLPRDSLRNIRTGHQFQLRFKAYPFTEFGYVEGRLKQIVESVPGGRVELLIELPNGLTTNHGQAIPYNEGMKAEALMVINDTRLLQRLCKPVFHLFPFGIHVSSFHSLKKEGIACFAIELFCQFS